MSNISQSIATTPARRDHAEPDSAVDTPQAHPRRRRATAGSALFGWALVLPAVVLLAIFVAEPIAKTIIDSFKVNGGIGLGNYRFSVDDPAFVPAVKDTLLWGAVAMLVAPTVGLLGASLVEDGPIRHKALLRFCFFSPYLLTLAAVGVVFTQMLDPSFGLVHAALSVVGLRSVKVDWLGSSTGVLWVGIALFIWNQSPFCFLVFSSAIRQIDRDIYDAALLDGASGVTRFRYITVPTLRPVTRSLRFIMLITGLTPFAVLFVLVTSNSTTQIIPTLIYNYGVEGNNQSEAGAMSAMFAGFLACLVLGFGALMGRRKSNAR
jgi:ABC-type sugar transport system permease subunit